MRTTTLDTADHTLLMGVVDVAPDASADGGAVSHGLDLVARGADLVAVGAPGGRSGPPDEEITCVRSVVEALAARGVVVAVDTATPAVAAAVLAAGAEIIGDPGGLRDPEMAETCAAAGCGVVILHTHEPSAAEGRVDDDVALDVAFRLRDDAAAAQRLGVAADQICLDPGIGVGTTWRHDVHLLRRLDRLVGLGYPVLLGAPSPTFVDEILEAAGHPAGPSGRDAAEMAAVALAVASGVAVMRVHDVAGALQVARTADAIVQSSIPGV